MKQCISILMLSCFIIVSCSLDRNNPLDPKNDATIMIPNDISGVSLQVSPGTTEPRWIQINWNRDNTVDGYYIYRAFSRQSSFVRIATIDNNQTESYRDHDNIISNRDYWYKISAYIDYGEKGILEGNPSSMQGIRVN